jgi:hypothetical protein
MYGVAGEKRPIFLESDAFSYNQPRRPYLKHVLLIFQICIINEDGIQYYHTPSPHHFHIYVMTL